MSTRLNLKSAGVALGGLLVGLALAYALSLPRITLAAPAAVAASTSAAIELRFSQPMAPDSVVGRFAVDPPLDGTLSWPDPQTLRFEPDGSLAADTGYAIRLAPGVRTARGVILPWGARLSFATGHPTLLYLALPPEGEGQINLWQVEPDGGNPRQLAELGPGESVHSYAVSPDGEQIALSLEREDGGADLALLARAGARSARPEPLLDCPANACIQPAWSPDGSRIAYEPHQ